VGYKRESIRQQSLGLEGQQKLLVADFLVMVEVCLCDEVVDELGGHLEAHAGDGLGEFGSADLAVAVCVEVVEDVVHVVLLLAVVVSDQTGDELVVVDLPVFVKVHRLQHLVQLGVGSGRARRRQCLLDFGH